MTNLDDITFDVNLEDMVQAIDEPHQPGKHRSLIVALLNAHILDRHPHAAGFGNRPLPVTNDEFSDLKVQVVLKLLAWVKSSGGSAPCLTVSCDVRLTLAAAPFPTGDRRSVHGA